MNFPSVLSLRGWLGVWAGLVFAGALAIWSGHAHALVIPPELHAASAAKSHKGMTDGMPCAACQVALPGQAGLNGDAVPKINAASGWPPGIPDQPHVQVSNVRSSPLLPLRILYCRWLK
jgi:hypothetical protein